MATTELKCPICGHGTEVEPAQDLAPVQCKQCGYLLERPEAPAATELAPEAPAVSAAAPPTDAPPATLEDAGAPPKSRPSLRFNWATSCAVVCLGFLVLLGLALFFAQGLLRHSFDSGERVITAIPEAFKPQVNYKTIVASSLSNLREKRDLIVLQAEVDVEISKEDSLSMFNDWLYLGTSVTSVRALGNRIQYFVPLADISEEDFMLSETNKRIYVIVPVPRFNEEVVEVQSDPERVQIQTERGWARLPSSAESLEHSARAELREKVVEEGKKPALLTIAKVNARKAVTEFLAGLTQTLDAELTLEVCFEDEIPNGPGVVPLLLEEKG
ncbi:MAG: DUF4230 domain-containing protein [Candidatus Hydrogenedentes bacterium]|nr:DUF4230 domain-containing protein [Candidatus Hydrogenedentota bacterium]